jgi:hypothetical protein
MEHLITNLIVPELNLTCFRESNKYMKHYMAYYTKHLITNLIVPELNLTCLRGMKQHFSDKEEHIRLFATWHILPHGNFVFLDPRHVLYALRYHIVINPLFEITSRRFWWRWEEHNVNTLQKIKWSMTTILRIWNVNVRTETTFRGFSSSQPQWNGHVGWGQDQYLLSYVSWSKLLWDWQSKSHLHMDLSASAKGFSSWFGPFGGRPLFFSLSFCLTHQGDQGSDSLLPIMCGLHMYAS